MARWDLIERALQVETHLARSRADLASALARRELNRLAQVQRQAMFAPPVMVSKLQALDLLDQRRAA